MNILLKKGDVFLTRGDGFISRAIRFFTREIGEKRTKVNHVGLVVQSGNLESAIVVEALTRVKRHKLWSQYGPPKKDLVAVYRAINLTQEQVDKIVAEAESQVGKKYGYLKIVAHLMDWSLLGAYMFRRMVPDGKYPICSWLVAHSFSKAGKHFGVEPGAGTPDDIWDFVAERKPSKYDQIHPLKLLAQE
jgi:hypothetical protein